MQEREEGWQGLAECVDCGAALSAAAERDYRGDGEWTLCSACALERGARYDEDEGCWIVPPDMTGLVVDREHRVR